MSYFVRFCCPRILLPERAVGSGSNPVSKWIGIRTEHTLLGERTVGRHANDAAAAVLSGPERAVRTRGDSFKRALIPRNRMLNKPNLLRS